MSIFLKYRKQNRLRNHKTSLLWFFFIVILFATAYSESTLLKQDGSQKNNLCREKSKTILPSWPFSRSQKISVFKKDGSVQCPEEKCTHEKCEKNLVISPKEMAKTLKSSGIRVFKAIQGHLPRQRGMAVCGAPTQNINIFYISKKHQKKAQEKGFQLCIPQDQ